MAKQPKAWAGVSKHGKPSSLLDTRVVYCGDNLEQLKKLPDRCVDLIYIDPPVQLQPQQPRWLKWQDLRTWMISMTLSVVTGSSRTRRQFFSRLSVRWI
jgi:16S rRNA G966 N2-methylase RsmD